MVIVVVTVVNSDIDRNSVPRLGLIVEMIGCDGCCLATGMYPPRNKDDDRS
uniref:Bm10282 n=1 Tax=Brugia malayi TaxID=6279 RepID=A0A1I9G0L6_BRUMA|nr:Bm10282 [Brugia malayi]